MRKSALAMVMIVAASFVSVRAQEGTDRELNALAVSHRRELEAAEAAELAVYADQLTALHKTAVARNDAAGAEKVSVELVEVLRRLKPHVTAAPPKLPPGLPAPTAARENKDESMEDMFAEEAAKGAEAKSERRPPPGDGRRSLVLRPQRGERTPNVRLNRELWAAPGARVKWTIEDLAPGKYRVTFRYKAAKDQSGGTGTIELTGFDAPIPFSITPASTATEEVASLDVALINLEKSPVDFTIRSTGLSTGSGPLFDLQAVLFTPENPRAGREDPPRDPEKKPPPQPPEEPRRKMDF